MLEFYQTTEPLPLRRRVPRSLKFFRGESTIMAVVPSRERLEAVIDVFPTVRIAVVGDLILDSFIWGKVDRISPEAPVPVVEVVQETECLGGAANVARNLAALGAQPVLIGVVGADSAGRRFLELLGEDGIDGGGVVVDSSRRTTAKSRIIAHQQQVCRFDREDRTPPTGARLEEVRRRALESLHALRAVIISDYAKGMVSSALTEPLIRSCRSEGIIVAADPKVRDLEPYRGVDVITPNRHEAELASGVSIVDRDSLGHAARIVQERCSARQVLITRGEEGMSLLDGDGLHDFPAAGREVFDVTGAGDTVIAAFALALAAGATPPEAAFLSNHAAGIVVGKLGTATLTRDELRRALNSTLNR
jgi:D-glycero-beta-D-manno-heptose-7-phosphate kinase